MLEPVSRLQKIVSISSGLGVALFGALVLAGWAFDTPSLRNVLPDLVTIKANAALAFLLAGASLLLFYILEGRLLWISRFLSLLVSLAGLSTFSEHLLGIDFGIDQILFQEPATAAGTHFPGRMPPTTALSFFMIGISIFLLKRPGAYHPFHAFDTSKIGQFLILTTGLIGLLMGYAYGVRDLYGVASSTQMAIHTAVAFVVLSLGALFSQGPTGLMRIVLSDGLAGVVSRRLLPAAVIVPFLIGMLRLIGERKGLYETEFGLALLVLAHAIVFFGLVWWTATLLFQTEEERREIERFKDQIVAIVSHEFRTPLAAMKNVITLMLRGITGPLSEKQVDYLQMAKRNVERLSHIVSDLLDISKFKTRRLTFQKGPVGLPALIEEVVVSFHASTAEKKVSLVTSCSPNLPPAMADGTRIGQVLTNLIGNAIKFTPEGGTITVSAQSNDGREVEVGVRDTGSGIPSQQVDRIFNWFEVVREEGGEPVTGTGTGIGLALCKEIVELHGGRIWVKSEEGRGAQFSFTLPISLEKEISNGPAQKAHFGG